MSADEMRAWYADYIEVCNRHDLDAIRERLDPDVRRAHLARGADAWVADIDDLLHAFPDWRWKIVSVIAEGDRLAAHLRASGTHSGVFRGLAATGRRVNVAEFAMYRVSGGRIREFAGTADNAELVRQLGG